jgi:1-acyl-sn-glycerol-3-phosphate acyltransferase
MPRPLDTAASVLEEGKLFGIFPEATPSRDGNLHRGLLASLAWRCVPARRSSLWAPVIPVGIRGHRPDPTAGCVGPPTVPGSRGELRAADPCRALPQPVPRTRCLRRLTDEIMCAICQLSGQIHLDRYADRPERPAPVIRPPAEVRSPVGCSAPPHTSGCDGRSTGLRFQ